MASHVPIGIDLGTSTSEICAYRNGEPYVIPDPTSPSKSAVVPSLVAINKRGELLVGESARPYVDLPGHGIREAKRMLGRGQKVKLFDKEYRPEEISAIILRKLKENAEQALGTTVEEVVLSVPANFPDAARQATLDAGELAGLKVTRLINEPTAAALAFGIKNLDAEEQIVVFDFGGGTLDISVLEMVAGVLDVKSSFGDPQLGGKDFDEAMMQLILRKFKDEVGQRSISYRAMSELKSKAEQAKVALSDGRAYDIRILSFALHDGSPIDLEVEVTRAEFEQAVAPLLDRTRSCLQHALDAGKVRPRSVDRVLLVGGTTYIPAVRQVVAEMFGKEPRADVNPDLAVAMGASIEAALMQGLLDQEESIILSDVSPFGLGIDIVSEVGGQFMLLYDPLIKPNTKIPYSTKKQYSLLHTDQHSLEIRLYQDHLGNARLLDEVIDTGIHGTISDIPSSLTGKPHPVEVDFSYDVSGVARIRATLPATGQSIDIAYQHSPKRLSSDEKTLAVVRVDELWQRTSKARQYAGLLAKASRLLEALPLRDRGTLSHAVNELKQALASENDEIIDRAENALIDIIFDIENKQGG